MNIVKIIDTICLGYSKDFKEAFFRETVLLKNGQTKTMYGTNIQTPSGETMTLPLTEQRPDIAQPA